MIKQTTQRDTFLNGEGDAWFERTREQHQPNPFNFKLLKFLSNSKIQFSKALEVGCSYGFLLDSIRKRKGCKCCGVDVSSKAICEGRVKYPLVSLEVGSSDSLPFPDSTFDFVLSSFLFHWIDRNYLYRSVSEIDRVLKLGGYLLLADFYSNNFLKVSYHHLPKEYVFTYKQDYTKLFLASGLYDLVRLDVGKYDETDNYFICLLRKK